MTQFEKMTATPVSKLIISLSVPTIISMLVTNIYNLVDTAFVGKLGTSASGAVGVVFGFMAILQAIGFMFGQGSGSIISRNLGNRNAKEASIIASTGFFFAFVIAIAVAVVCIVFIEPLIVFLGSTPTIAPYAKVYIKFIIAVAPFLVTTFTLNNILRYEGKAFYGMIGLLSGAVLNICGDAVLMFGFKMGIAGAGLSTALSQLVSFGILLVPFFSGKTQSRLSFRNICFSPKKVLDIMGTGLPSLLRQGLNSLTTILMNMEAAVYGDAAVAAMSICSRLFFFIFSIAIGVGQGFQPVSGFNYGAKRFDRLRKAYKFTWLFSEGMMIVFGAVVIVFAPWLVALMRNDPTVIEIGARALRLLCVSSVFLPLCMVTEMLFQSTGRKLYASILSSLRSGVLMIPILLIMANVRGLAGIQEAQPLSLVLSFIPTVFFAVNYFKKLPDSKELNK